MSAPSRILVAALDNLGDTVMATSVLKPLKRQLPGARIGLFVKRYAADILADHAADPFWDTSPGQPKGRVAAYLRTLSDIRRERYDAVLLLNTEWRRALSAFVAAIPKRIGYRRRSAGAFLTSALEPSAGSAHFVDDHRRLLEALVSPISSDEVSPRLEVTREDAAWADSWRQSVGWGLPRDQGRLAHRHDRQARIARYLSKRSRPLAWKASSPRSRGRSPPGSP